MKSTQKGNQYEREARDILVREDYLVEGQHRRVMYIRDKKTGLMKLIMAGRDIFGCDLIAKKSGFKTKWIQVSTVPQKSVKEKQVLEFPINFEYEDYELWLRVHGKREFRVFALTFNANNGEYYFAETETKFVKGDKNGTKDSEGTEGFEKEVVEGDLGRHQKAETA